MHKVKTLKYTTGLLFIFIFLSISCKSKFEIAGSWFIDKEEMYINGTLVNTVKNNNVTIHFNEDGTGRDDKGDFLWDISESTLTINDNGEIFEYTIRLKKNNKLVIEDKGFTSYENTKDFIVLTLTR